MENILDSHLQAYQGLSIYDFDNRILLTWYPQRILMIAQGASSILELGVGHGLTTSIFSNNFERHVVLEGSPAIIRNFKEKFPGCDAEIIETYFEDFHTEEKFDVIVMGFVLEHVDDPFGIMTRYKNFLSPGGKFFLTVPNAAVLNRRLGHIAGMLDDITTLSENDFQQGHKRYYTVASLTEVINRAGFKIDKLEGIYLKPLTSRQIISLNLEEGIISALCEVGVDYPELSCGILAQISPT